MLEIGVALASALAHAHARGVIHRDIKPQNVLVPHPARGRLARRPQTLLAAAKLTDFGGASLVGEDALTRTGDVLGTLAYMAPEQSEGREVGVEADLYSLALVIYEALCGVNPVRGATPAATVRRIGRPLPPLQRARRDLPRELTRALDRALAPAPGERGTLEELRVALEDALERGLRRSRWRRTAHGDAPSPTRRDAAARQSRRAHAGRGRTAGALARGTTVLPAPAPRASHAAPSREQRSRPRRARIRLPRARVARRAPAPSSAGRRSPGAPASRCWRSRRCCRLLALLPASAATRAWASAGSRLRWRRLLGLLGLAGAFPAIAGTGVALARARRARRARLLVADARRAAARARLWLGAPRGTPAARRLGGLARRSPPRT